MTGGASRPALGIALVALMSVVFAGMDTLVKWLGSVLPVLLLLWTRYAFQALAMAAWQARRGAAGFRSAHPRFQFVRGLLDALPSATTHPAIKAARAAIAKATGERP